MIGRLCVVELRKTVDTVAGFVLLVVGAVLAGVFGGGGMLYRPGASLSDIAQLAGVPGGTLATVMAILLVTSERSHHTALVTYVMTPRRELVVLAKAVAAAALGVVVVLLAVLAALLIMPVGSLVTSQAASWTVEPGQLTWWAVGTVAAALSGFALGLVLGNAPAAITIVLVWPMLSSMLGRVPGLDTVLPWLDISAMGALSDGATAVEVGRTVTGLLAWVVVPAAVGVWRLVRSEVR